MKSAHTTSVVLGPEVLTRHPDNTTSFVSLRGKDLSKPAAVRYPMPDLTPDPEAYETQVETLPCKSDCSVKLSDGCASTGEHFPTQTTKLRHDYAKVPKEVCPECNRSQGPLPKPKLSIRRRKSIVLFNTRPKIFRSMKVRTQKMLLSTVTKEDFHDPVNRDLCWTYGRITTTQSRDHCIALRALIDKHNKWKMQFGLAYLLVTGRLTRAQKRGVVRNGWHLTHLCGDWRCMNHRHFTVEAAEINWDRENCFKDRRCTDCVKGLKCHKRTSCKPIRQICPHEPPCLVRARSKRWRKSSEELALDLSYAWDTDFGLNLVDLVTRWCA